MVTYHSLIVFIKAIILLCIMDKKVCDLIVVYSEFANSAGDKQYKEKAPFSFKGRYEIYNDSYSYFLVKCKKMGIKAAFTSSKDIIGPGLFQSFWTYNKKWIRHSGKAYSKIIFDKFAPFTTTQKNRLKLLTSSKDIYLFNKKKIREIFQDKLNTYNCFKEFAIPSGEIVNPSKQKVILAKNKLDKLLKNHKWRGDFNDGCIIKDKTGAGGFRIHKINLKKGGFQKIKKYYKLDKKNKGILSYIFQPFIDCDKGFNFEKYQGFIDLRLILLNHKIVQAYVRIAKKGKFRCNEHQGGNLIYISQKIVPKKVITLIKKIIKKLDTKLDLKHSLYALDFIQSNNGNLYFIEGNNNPGLDWDHTKKVNEEKSKELVNIIVNEVRSIIREKRN
jgi:glutathione synthase/RimK-type ligase-like ATP-grasp enzyme